MNLNKRKVVIMLIKCPGWSVHPPNIVWTINITNGKYNHSIYDRLVENAKKNKKQLKFDYQNTDTYPSLTEGLNYDD